MRGTTTTKNLISQDTHYMSEVEVEKYVNEVESEIKRHDVLMVVVPKQEYFEKTVEIAEICSHLFERTCYVSMNKPATTLLDLWEKRGIDLKRFVIIDCVGEKGEQRVKIIHVSSPIDLRGISLAVREFIDEGIKCLIFDSVSTLMLYEDPAEILKFIHVKITRMRKHRVKGIFMSLKGDVNRKILEQMSMFVDRVISLSQDSMERTGFERMVWLSEIE